MDKIAEFLIEKETITGKEFMKIFREVKGLPEQEDDPDDGGNKAERIAMKAAGVIPEEESGKSGEDEAAAGTEAPLDEGEISGPAQTGVEEETEFSENPVEEESAYRTE